MSYNIIKSINIKKHTITAACNNIRPLIYTTGPFSEPVSDDEEFIKRCLVAFNDGEFFSTSESCWKFNYSVLEFDRNYKTLKEKLHTIIWENYDYSTKTKLYSDDEIEQAKQTLADTLYSIYKNLENRKTGDFVISYNGSYFVNKLTKRYIKYTVGNKYKVFKSREQAEVYLGDRLKDNKFNIFQLDKFVY